MCFAMDLTGSRNFSVTCPSTTDAGREEVLAVLAASGGLGGTGETGVEVADGDLGVDDDGCLGVGDAESITLKRAVNLQHRPFGQGFQ